MNDGLSDGSSDDETYARSSHQRKKRTNQMIRCHQTLNWKRKSCCCCCCCCCHHCCCHHWEENPSQNDGDLFCERSQLDSACCEGF